LQHIVHSIGTGSPIKNAGHLYLLNPIQPKTRSEFLPTTEKKALFATEIQAQRKEIESIKDPERRAQALQQLEASEKQLLLGLAFQDRKVVYNPLPTQLFDDAFCQIWQTLRSLVSGLLNVKALSGPVGIVKEVYAVSLIGFKESLYFLGFMSLNLGIFNLLPMPILDGGTITITLLEMITRRRIPPKTLEMIMIPFVLLLAGFFIYVTFNDISQMFSGFQDFFNGFWR
jgi:regulator of sigma E protease